jgi:hypothetical protein
MSLRSIAGSLTALSLVLVLALAVSGPRSASATTLPRHVISCRSMTSSGLASNVVLNDCRRPRTTGGVGVSNGFGLGPYPVTWMTGKETNFQTVSSTLLYPGRCPAPLYGELDFVGTVVTVEGPWTKQFLGETITFDVCLNTDLAIVGLVPGTLFRIAP